MKNEYVIISKTAIQQRIEELRFMAKIGEETNPELIKASEYRISEIELMLSKSSPLIPEIEKAFTKGERYGWDTQKSIGNIEQIKEKIKFQSLKDYISNLKLDI